MNSFSKECNLNGKRAKDLRRLAKSLHDPQFADKVNTMNFDREYKTGVVDAEGNVITIKMPITIHQHNPHSIRGTEQRAKKAYKQWALAGHPKP